MEIKNRITILILILIILLNLQIAYADEVKTASVQKIDLSFEQAYELAAKTLDEEAKRQSNH